MKPRWKIKVDVVGRPSLGNGVAIRPIRGESGAITFGLYSAEGETLARCDSAKKLSDWAFDNGAQTVCHDYDIKLSDGEL